MSCDDDKFGETQEKLRIRLESCHDSIEKFEHFLTGNGKPETGLMFRMGLMEQRMKQLLWAAGIIVALGVTIVGGVTVAVVVNALGKP